MNCPKCHGLMVVDDAYDPDTSAEAAWTKIYRCIICGNIIDPVIHYHKTQYVHPIKSRKLRRKPRHHTWNI